MEKRKLKFLDCSRTFRQISDRSNCLAAMAIMCRRSKKGKHTSLELRFGIHFVRERKEKE